MRVHLNDATIPHFLELLRPKLEYYTSLDESMSVLEALKEIQSHDTSADGEVGCWGLGAGGAKQGTISPYRRPRPRLDKILQAHG